MATACGDDGGHNTLPDAPIGGDAPATDAPPQTGSVNIIATARASGTLAAGAPVQNVLVVALDRAGAVVGTAMTGADGKAKIDGLTEGASVTAVYPDDGGDRAVVTYVGVKPNDTLRVGDSYYDTAAAGTAGLFTVSWTAVANADHYYLYTPCYGGKYIAGTGTSTTIDLEAYCQTPTAPLVLNAYDQNYNIISSVQLAATPYTPGTQLALTAAQWVAPADFSVSAAGLSAPTNDAYLGVLSDFHGFNDDNGNYATVEAGAATLGGPIKVPAASTHTAYAELSRDGNYGRQYAYKRGTSPIALTGPTLPWLGGLIANATQAAWLQSTGSTYDAAVLQFRWRRFENKSSQDWRWNIILPPGLASFAFPTPPAQLADVLPDDTTSVDSSLRFIDLASAADYDAARALPEYRLTDAVTAVRRGDETGLTSSVADGGEGSGFAPPPQ